MKYVCCIGSNSKNDIVLNDKTAADFHAEIFMDSDSNICIKDLNTKFGTRVNGTKISVHKLSRNDEIQIGFSKIDWLKFANAWLFEEVQNKDSTNKSTNDVTNRLAADAGSKNAMEFNPEESIKEISLAGEAGKTAASQAIVQETLELESEPQFIDDSPDNSIKKSKNQEIPYASNPEDPSPEKSSLTQKDKSKRALNPRESNSKKLTPIQWLTITFGLLISMLCMGWIAASFWS